MSYELEAHDYKGYVIKIMHDDDPINPRKDYDNFGTMICWHGRYDLGDSHDHREPEDFMKDLAGWDVASRLDSRYEKWTDGLYSREMGPNERERESRLLYARYREDLRAAAEKNAVILPLFLYDHSGITISTGPFSCPWDSGQVGWIYVTKDQIRKEYGVSRITKKVREKVIKLLEAEVETYDQYLTGDVWGFVIEHPEDGEVDSCWGFFGDEYCLKEARAAVDAEDRSRHPLLEEQNNASIPLV